jgi:hypothetical protein
VKVLQILVLIIGSVVSASAQKAVLSGTVYDPTGAVIPRVNVEFTTSKGEKFKSFTNEEGFYWIFLPKSKYELPSSNDLNKTANKLIKYEIVFNDNPYSGFQKFVIKDFILSGKMQLDIALEAKSTKPTSITDDMETEISNKVLQTRPLEQLPKEQNKPKRKNKNK